MRNAFCKKPLWEVNDRLVRVAQGKEPADTVIRHATLVSVTTHELLEDADIAIASGRIAYLGIAGHTAKHCIGEKTVVIDASGLYATPGLIDSHIHIESAMIGPSEYARAVVPHGTTAILADPHEVANVRGLEGVTSMWEDAARTPLKTMLTTPSCVPAVLGVEDTGSSIDAAQVEKTMSWPETYGLGEMMNFPGILNNEPNATNEVRETLKADRRVTGHYSVVESDRGLAAYIAAGISSCHESIGIDDVVAKLRMGMWVQLRYGSAWHNLPVYLPPLLETGIDLRHCLLCSDDNHPNTLVSDGHMDRILREAVRLGCHPITALQMATINCAEYLGIGEDMGSITPGKCADLVLMRDLTNFEAVQVYIDGVLVAQNGKPCFEVEPFAWPDYMTNTMNLGCEISADTFRIPAPANKRADASATCKVRTITVDPGQTITRNTICEAPIVDGSLCADHASDLLKLCVFDRHHGAEGTHAFGFVHGFGIHGALAQTVAHDAHNLLVMGDNDEDMALAARTLVECGGGEVAVADGKVLALVELPICGLMSTLPAEQVAAQVQKVEQAWVQMGNTMPSPFMTMGVMSLACVPELRLTNRGYVNCVTFTMEDLIAE
ncbi:MAG: adenine deaminase [Atopobium sp.]|uniref:adenine deaminase n=1 Tax=Atopobium sp. TaxID=1872650 RepID=UPI002A756C23|nr:adenine deaminase [Atopobium sp.]MDY2788418.1 adenine deaminase [Atopobium sp.]MDY4522706.1 adenine deaminase [Atopobium sp.]